MKKPARGGGKKKRGGGSNKKGSSFSAVADTQHRAQVRGVVKTKINVSNPILPENPAFFLHTFGKGSLFPFRATFKYPYLTSRSPLLFPVLHLQQPAPHHVLNLQLLIFFVLLLLVARSSSSSAGDNLGASERERRRVHRMKKRTSSEKKNTAMKNSFQDHVLLIFCNMRAYNARFVLPFHHDCGCDDSEISCCIPCVGRRRRRKD